MTKKLKFFDKIGHSKILAGESFFPSPQTRRQVSRLWLHVTTTSFICVISAPACLIHSSTTASSAWCMGFLGQRVSHPTWSSTRFRAGTLLHIVYTSQFGLPLLHVPCWVRSRHHQLMMSRPDRTVVQL